MSHLCDIMKKCVVYQKYIYAQGKILDDLMYKKIEPLEDFCKNWFRD